MNIPKAKRLFASCAARIPQFLHFRMSMMMLLGFKRRSWLLLLLALLYLTVPVREIAAGGSSEQTTTARDTKQSKTIAHRKDKTSDKTISSNVEIRINENKQFVQANDFVMENPLEDERKFEATKKPPLPRPNAMMQRIERASSPSLYDQMRSKLQSLGAAVTEKQLSVAATKCGRQEPRLHYVQSYDFVRSAEHLCSVELLALVAVHSNAKNFERRATIRRTWGSLRYVGQFRIEVAFFLGLPASGDSDESGATGAQLRARIGAESDRFGDIVQLGFTENYRNLTIKHLGVYEWLLRHCRSARYLVKVDDDTFTDVAHLATFLSRGAPPGFFCSATLGAKPKRVRRGHNAKWMVSYSEFPDNVYPTYCEGFGYIVHTKHIADIYLCSLFKKFFWIDDVHVTGILAKSVGVSVTRFWRGHGYTVLVPSLASESIMDYIFLTAYNSEFFAGLWAKLWQAVLRYSLDNAL